MAVPLLCTPCSFKDISASAICHLRGLWKLIGIKIGVLLSTLLVNLYKANFMTSKIIKYLAQLRSNKVTHRII